MKPSQVPAAHRLIVAEMETELSRWSDDVPLLWTDRDTPARLRHADLTLVTRGMRDAALDGARDVPPVVFDELAPSSAGMIVYEGGLPAIEIDMGSEVASALTAKAPAGDRQAAMNARVISGRPTVVGWATLPEGRAFLGMWAHHSDLSTPRPNLLAPEGVAWPLLASAIINRERPFDFDVVDDEVSVRALSLLAATWVMSSTPTVADARTTMQPGAKIPGQSRRDLPREVKVIELRRLARKGGASDPDEPSEAKAREYRHQWVVRGHWRQQAVGKGRQSHRTTWIPSYVKGPEGAPFLPSETVFVWRR